MTPILSPRHPWRLQFSEIPLPAMLPRESDVVHVSMGLGMAALDAMIDFENRVGPLLCCITHRRLLVPVDSGAASLWRASHSVCDTGLTLRCSRQGPPSMCHDRFWVMPPQPRAYSTTDPMTFHHRLSLARSQMRDSSRLGHGPHAIGGSDLPSTFTVQHEPFLAPPEHPQRVSAATSFVGI
ncbi:hypothetical protein [Streptomyces sp. NPDC007088]|uniref:hypothetical protein n=1 Tax=Streptomyces sp. NPDC007088 TaxID=3364773 RepID=UPI0036BDF0E7